LQNIKWQTHNISKFQFSDYS